MVLHPGGCGRVTRRRIQPLGPLPRSGLSGSRGGGPFFSLSAAPCPPAPGPSAGSPGGGVLCVFAWPFALLSDPPARPHPPMARGCRRRVVPGGPGGVPSRGASTDPKPRHQQSVGGHFPCVRGPAVPDTEHHQNPRFPRVSRGDPTGSVQNKPEDPAICPTRTSVFEANAWLT